MASSTLSRCHRNVAPNHGSNATETIKEVALKGQEIATEIAHSLTVSWHELEGWQRDNEFIIKRYRRAQNTWKGCWESVFGYIHNETVNIHSHLGGALLFLFLLLSFSSNNLSRYETTSWKDLGVFMVFLSSAVFCLACSAFYHTCTCHSEKVSKSCQAFDYTGIIVLTVGSFYPAIYYGFYCSSVWKRAYLTSITLVGLGALSIVLNPKYGKPSYRGARTKVFVGLGLCGVVPVIHALITRGYTHMRNEMGFDYLLLSAASYLVGALLYANRIPERWYPGRFDLWGASHQIFHFHVVAAAAAHYACIVKAFDYWHGIYAVCV